MGVFSRIPKVDVFDQERKKSKVLLAAARHKKVVEILKTLDKADNMAASVRSLHLLTKELKGYRSDLGILHPKFKDYLKGCEVHVGDAVKTCGKSILVMKLWPENAQELKSLRAQLPDTGKMSRDEVSALVTRIRAVIRLVDMNVENLLKEEPRLKTLKDTLIQTSKDAEELYKAKFDHEKNNPGKPFPAGHWKVFTAKLAKCIQAIEKGARV